MNEVVVVDNTSYLLRDIRDLEQILSPEIFEIVQNVIQGDKRPLIEQIDILEDDLKYYEMRSEDLNRCLLELRDIIGDQIQGIKNAKRLNRRKILDTLKTCLTLIENESI